MQIRFLQTTDSGTPGFPFEAGQVIDVAEPSDYLLSLLDGVRAEAIRQDGTLEQAIAGPRERARRRGVSHAHRVDAD